MAKKILIVEDDKFLRELIVRKLTNEGYEPIEAVDGEQGIQKIKETKPDLVLWILFYRVSMDSRFWRKKGRSFYSSNPGNYFIEFRAKGRR